VIDGHDVEAVCKAFYEAKTTKDRPTAILAKTYKGKGVEGMVIQTLFSQPLLSCWPILVAKQAKVTHSELMPPTFQFSVP